MTGKFLVSLVPSSGQVALLSLVTLQLQRMLQLCSHHHFRYPHRFV